MKRSQNLRTVQDVDGYLASFPKEVKAVLEKLRRAIKAAAPQAEELISYRIPTYKYRGPLVHFMAGKSHCSFITVSSSIVKTLKGELKGYRVSGTTIQFLPQHPLAPSLIEKIVKARIRENEAAAKEKARNQQSKRG